VTNGIVHLEKGDLLLIDKPTGWSSFDVVKKVRWAAPNRKAGHAGTLDPLATGLLLVCTGAQTKNIDQLQSLPKVYEAVLKFGFVTQSYDAEMPETPFGTDKHIDIHKLEEALQSFVGIIEQVPPLFSAVKIDGERAYKVARRGEQKTLNARPVTIHSIKLLHFDMPFATIEIICGKGTYIRSIVHDLGQSLGCGAYMTSLKRTSIGPYHLRYAQSPQAICDYFNAYGSLPRP
jgi:tRNA pseudouridine55 synthase